MRRHEVKRIEQIKAGQCLPQQQAQGLLQSCSVRYEEQDVTALHVDVREVHEKVFLILKAVLSSPGFKNDSSSSQFQHDSVLF
jgi:hypothetical protein